MKARLVTVLLILAGGCGVNSQQPLVGTLERDRIEVAAEHNETISAIPVTEGEVVESGQVLAQLDTMRLDARLEQARARRDAAAAQLAELVRGPRTEAIKETRAALARAEAELEYARQEYRRIEKLEAKQLASQAELDQVRSRRDAAAAARAEIAARLEAMLAGTTQEELDRSRAELRATEGNINELQIERDKLTLRAPHAGVVDALPREPGERVRAGDVVAVLLASDSLYARVYVPETLRGSLSAGMPARVHYDGLDRPLQGEVRFIASEAAFTPFFALTDRDRGRLAYLAEITITGDVPANLPAGMPVQVRFPGLE